MLSKNNNRELQRKIDDKQDRFTLRKLSIGVASVLLGSFIHKFARIPPLL